MLNVSIGWVSNYLHGCRYCYTLYENLMCTVKPRFTAPQNGPPILKIRSTTRPVYERVILCKLNYQIGFSASCKLEKLIRSRIRLIWELIRVRSTDWVQFMLDEKPCDPDYWNPDLTFTPIYRTFFRSPKLCGKSGFYCTTCRKSGVFELSTIRSSLTNTEW